MELGGGCSGSTIVGVGDLEPPQSYTMSSNTVTLSSQVCI
jgi:hypothetical protein